MISGTALYVMENDNAILRVRFNEGTLKFSKKAIEIERVRGGNCLTWNISDLRAAINQMC